MGSIEASEESWQEIGEGDARFVQLDDYGATEETTATEGLEEDAAKLLFNGLY
jgi:hypothetical protein